MANLCNLDGVVGPEADARISVLDRSFLFGDSVYEVIRTLDGQPFAWREHLDRLRASAAGILLDLDLDDRTIMTRIRDTMAQAGNAESYVRIVVSRGTGRAPNIDLGQVAGPPTWVILVRDLPATTWQPVHLAIVDRLRNDARALPPAVKSGNYLNNVLALAEAKRRGATDCLMLNAAGHVTEASTANVFAVLDGELVTPPLSAGILAGVTRALLLRHATATGQRCAERDFTADELAGADEIFLSSTLRDVNAVTVLNGRPVGDGRPGPRTRALAASFGGFARSLLREVHQPELAALLRPAER